DVVPCGTQVLIPNTLHHRDDQRYPDADRFRPEAWLAGGSPRPGLFNHLGGGPQACAGASLALFLAKSVLATLLRHGRYTLDRPSLDPAEPLPRAYNYFALRLSRGRV
ncbi:MAG TPA: cytochrome P450, partial [Humisphaera sp.]